MHFFGFGSSLVVLEGAEIVADVDEGDRKRGRERFLIFDMIMMDRMALEWSGPPPVIFAAFVS